MKRFVTTPQLQVYTGVIILNVENRNIYHSYILYVAKQDSRTCKAPSQRELSHMKSCLSQSHVIQSHVNAVKTTKSDDNPQKLHKQCKGALSGTLQLWPTYHAS